MSIISLILFLSDLLRAESSRVTERAGNNRKWWHDGNGAPQPNRLQPIQLILYFGFKSDVSQGRRIKTSRSERVLIRAEIWSQNSLMFETRLLHSPFRSSSHARWGALVLYRQPGTFWNLIGQRACVISVTWTTALCLFSLMTARSRRSCKLNRAITEL